jgi:hypothetical protein
VEIAILVVLLGGAAGWSLAIERRRKLRRRSLLGRIAAHLGGPDGDTAAFGARFGAAVTFRLATRRAGSDAEAWTQIDVVVPDAYPLAIHVRRHRWLDRAGIARRDLTDLQLGDPAFDEAFAVEAAPEDVARVLLGANLRDLLRAHTRAELDTTLVDNRKVLRFARRGWIDDLAIATSAIDVVASVGARVREAYAAADSAVPLRVAGSPYRPHLDDRSARDTSAARDAEVTLLESRRAGRARRRAAVTIAIVAALALALVALLAS